VTVDIEKLHSKSRNSPFHGFKLFGRVYHTIVDGNVVVRDKELVR